MTTIAYKDGILAADSRISDDSGFIYTDKWKKIYKLADGSLIGLSEMLEDDVILLEAMQDAIEKGEEPNLAEFPDIGHIGGILVKPDGKIYKTEGRIWFEWPENYAAIGSGKAVALAMLQKGCSAVEAVEAAIVLDCFSGGHIVTESLDGK